MSTIKVDTVRPVTTDASLTLQGDSSGSGVTGITIDSSGNATLNGTANDLGTVSAGTLGSGVVFPAGHVIQTTQNTYNSANSAATSSSTASKVSDGSSNYYWSHTISGLTSGNNVLINFNFIGAVNRPSGSGAAGHWHIYRDNTLIYSQTYGDYAQYIDAGGAGFAYNYTIINLSYMDTGATSGSHTYYLGYSSITTGSTVVRSSSQSAPFIAILQEIQT